MRKLSIILIAFLLLISGISEGYGQSGEDAEYDSRKEINFNFNKDKFVRNYKGDDIEIIFDEISGGISTDSLDSGFSNNIYAFKLNESTIGKYNLNKLNYDFNSKSLKILLQFSTVYIHGGDYKLDNVFKIKRGNIQKSGSFVGTNIYGARIKIEKIKGADYNITVANKERLLSLSTQKTESRKYTIQTNPLEIRPPEKPGGNLYEKTAERFSDFMIRVQMPPNLAARVENDIGIMFICKPKKPMIAVGEWSHDPTFSHPFSANIIQNCVNVKVLQIWVYNIKTGEIYHKQPVM